jgi:hypothetical protein
MFEISSSVRSRLALADRLALLMLLPLALTGCGVPSAKVSGQVVYQDKGQEKALPGGTVTFRPVDTTINPVTAEIGADGNYEAMVPAVEVKISVDNRGLKNPDASPVGVTSGPPQKVKGMPKGIPVGPPKDNDAAKDKDIPAISTQKPSGTYVRIPDKYYNTETSGLSLKVTKGSQTHKIELK